MAQTSEQILRTRLEQLNERILQQDDLTRAIHDGEVDALVVMEENGPKVFKVRSDEPLYRTMIEEMAHGVATVLVDGTVVYANPHLLTMVGRPGETFLGASVLPYIAETHQQLFMAMLRRAIHQPQELELAFRWATGEGPVLVSARRLPIADVDAIGIAIVDLRDQIARREAEEASRAKDELLASVSHEMRTPLTSMMGWVQMLEMEFAEDSRVSMALRNLKAAVLAEARIVDDLLDLSRSEHASLPLLLDRVDLREVIETAATYVSLQAQTKAVSLTVGLPEEPLPVLGDTNRLRQVFVNLFTNAVKFTDARGSVRLHVNRGDGHVDVTVADSGIGISKDFLPFVFEPFKRGDGAKHYQGLGIGLAIAKRLVDAHGGSITASSDGAGYGAVFTVRLPINQ